jgi:hypothetical protein
MHVLLIEHEAPLRQLFAAALQEAPIPGVGVQMTRSGMEGLHVLSDGEAPVLVYLAEALPGVNGGDVLAEMSRDPRLSQVPVLLRTDHLDSMFSMTMRIAGHQVTGRLHVVTTLMQQVRYQVSVARERLLRWGTPTGRRERGEPLPMRRAQFG